MLRWRLPEAAFSGASASYGKRGWQDLDKPVQSLKHLTKLWAFFMLAALLAFPITSQAQNEKPVVRAVMFWMDTCGHCHYVIDNVLPPLQEKYGEQLEILLIELDSIEAANLLYDTAEAYGIPRNNVGVPLLFIGDKALSGSHQIPAELPGLIDQHLAAGGVDFPGITGLAAFLPVQYPQGDDDDELCELSAPCPSVAEEGSDPPPIALPAVSSAGSTGSYPAPPTSLPYIPPEEQTDEASVSITDAAPSPSDNQVGFQPVEAEVEPGQASQERGFHFLPAAVGAVVGITAFFLYNVLKARQIKSQ
jgi:hypothetical protein